MDTSTKQKSPRSPEAESLPESCTSLQISNPTLLHISPRKAELESLHVSSPVTDPELLNTSLAIPEAESNKPLPNTKFKITPELKSCTSLPAPKPKLCTPLRLEAKLLDTSTKQKSPRSPEAESFHKLSPMADNELLNSSLPTSELALCNSSLKPKSFMSMQNSKLKQRPEPELACTLAQRSEVKLLDTSAKNAESLQTPLHNSSSVDLNLLTPLNDSGTVVDHSLNIVDTDAEDDDYDGDDNPGIDFAVNTKDSNALDRTVKHKNKDKPPRPCFFCKVPQTRLKRHILTKHKNEPQVVPLKSMNSKEQDRFITSFRKEAIKIHNIDLLKAGKSTFMRERKSSLNVITDEITDVPIMCVGCKGFFAKKYKARHQLICPASGSNLMLPMISISSHQHLDSLNNDFKVLLNTLL